MIKLILISLFSVNVAIAAPKLNICVPSLDNEIETSESPPCNDDTEKHQYEPVLLTERIFEKRSCEAETESGSNYEKGEELFVTGRSPFGTTHKDIQEVEEE